MKRTRINEFLYRAGRSVKDLLYEYMTEVMEQYPDVSRFRDVRTVVTERFWDQLEKGEYEHDGVVHSGRIMRNLDGWFKDIEHENNQLPTPLSLPLCEIRSKLDAAIMGILTLHGMKF